jgi:hypothetical protein
MPTERRYHCTGIRGKNDSFADGRKVRRPVGSGRNIGGVSMENVLSIVRSVICAAGVTVLASLGKVEGTYALFALAAIALPSLAGTLAEKFFTKK